MRCRNAERSAEPAATAPAEPIEAPAQAEEAVAAAPAGTEPSPAAATDA